MALLRAATLTVVITLAGYGATTTPLQAAGLKHAWDFATPGDLPQTAVRDLEGRPYLYAAIKNGGLLVLRLGQAKTGPQAVARLGTRAFAKLDVMNLVQNRDYLYLALGDFFSAGGSKADLAIVSVKIPQRPKVASLCKSARKIRGRAIVETDGKWAYLGAMSEGVIIFDVSNERQIREVPRILPDVIFPREIRAASNTRTRGAWRSGATRCLWRMMPAACGSSMFRTSGARARSANTSITR